MPDLVTYLNHAHVFEWCVNPRKDIKKNLCSKETGLCAQNMLIILRMVVNIIKETYMTIL